MKWDTPSIIKFVPFFPLKEEPESALGPLEGTAGSSAHVWVPGSPWWVPVGGGNTWSFQTSLEMVPGRCLGVAMGSPKFCRLGVHRVIFTSQDRWASCREAQAWQVALHRDLALGLGTGPAPGDEPSGGREETLEGPALLGGWGPCPALTLLGWLWSTTILEVRDISGVDNGLPANDTVQHLNHELKINFKSDCGNWVYGTIILLYK